MNRCAAALLAAVLAAPAAAFPGGAPAAPGAARALKGVVQEALPAGAYTYLLIKTDAGPQWAAVEKTALKAGAAVTVYEATVMEDFKSPLLKRTFERVVFGTLAGPGGAAPAAAKVPAAGHAVKTGAPPALPPTSAAARPKGTPTELSVADVHKRGPELAGKLVAVRGKVVKANANILGKNWYHLQDGSGDAKAGTNDLTVTAPGSAAKGNTVRAVGVLAANKDLGSGYAYAVILEDAELTPAK